MSTTWQGDMVELMVNRARLTDQIPGQSIHCSVTVKAVGHGSLHQAAALLCPSGQPCPGVRGLIVWAQWKGVAGS